MMIMGGATASRPIIRTVQVLRDDMAAVWMACATCFKVDSRQEFKCYMYVPKARTSLCLGHFG